MDRRAFIKRSAAAAAGTGLVGAGLAGAGAVSVYGWEGTTERVAQIPERVRTAVLSVEERVRSHYDYLDIDEGGLRAYADVHREQFGEGQWDYMFYQRFLLSTDFFQNGADESRPVQFVRYYDPYVNPCWNPLARPGPAAA